MTRNSSSNSSRRHLVREEKLTNSLSSGLGIGKETIKIALVSLGLNEKARAEELKLHELAALCEELRKAEN